MKRTVSCARGARTGPVNLALWRVPMTRDFTGHKSRGMRESRKWPTVSIFCQTASCLLIYFPAFCVYVCNSYIQIILPFSSNSDFLLSSVILCLYIYSLPFLALIFNAYTHTVSTTRHWCWRGNIGTPPSRLENVFVENEFRVHAKQTHTVRYLVVACVASRAEWQLHYDCCWRIRTQLSTLDYSFFNCLI